MSAEMNGLVLLEIIAMSKYVCRGSLSNWFKDLEHIEPNSNMITVG